MVVVSDIFQCPFMISKILHYNYAKGFGIALIYVG